MSLTTQLIAEAELVEKEATNHLYHSVITAPPYGFDQAHLKRALILSGVSHAFREAATMSAERDTRIAELRQK